MLGMVLSGCVGFAVLEKAGLPRSGISEAMPLQSSMAVQEVRQSHEEQGALLPVEQVLSNPQ